MREFDFINQCLKPLCDPGTLDDDTSAVLNGSQFVVNTDTIVEGRHFLPTDPPDTIAKKLVRVGISDLASTGARPKFVQLALSLGTLCDEAWLRAFAEGLGEDLSHFSLVLSGGDTTRTDGPTVLTATIIGDVEGRAPMRRWLAQPGDQVWIGRALGLGGLGLAEVLAKRNSPLAWRYWVPEPQLDLGLALASTGARIACADVSDGLGADLGHIAKTSDVKILLNRVPVEPGGDMNAGDDYCLLAVSDHDLAPFGMQRIGQVYDGAAGVWLDGQDISQSGYEHR